MLLPIRLRSTLLAIFRRTRVESDMDAELRHHIAARADDLERAGMPRTEAERTARLDFGSIESYKESCRQSLGMRLLDELRSDLRYTGHSLRRSPGFTALAIVSLALGIGANTAVFSIVDTVLLRPLPYGDPDRLISINQYDPKDHTWNAKLPPPLDLTAGDSVPSIESALGVDWNSYVLTGATEPEDLFTGMATSNLCRVLKVRPVLGRWFNSREETNRAKVAVLDFDLWRRQFHSDPKVLGRAITLKRAERQETFTVIGVMPRGFRIYSVSSLTYPLLWEPMPPRPRGNTFAVNIARLRPGASVEQAAAELRARQEPGGRRIVAAPVLDDIVGKRKPSLAVLLGTVSFVLLITCANLANLLLGRGSGRGKEVAVRASLGAGRLRLCRQLLTESLALAILGGAAGIFLAYFLLGFIQLQPERILPRIDQIRIDAAVLGFTVLISTLCGLLFGLLPALQLSRVDLAHEMKAAGAGAIGGPSRRIWMHTLVVLETAICLICMAGAGLMVNTFVRLNAIDPGFNHEHVLKAPISVPQSQDAALRFNDSLLERAAAIPGVESAAISDYLPLTHTRSMYSFKPPTGRSGPPLFLDHRTVSPDYFRLMRIPILRGRPFRRGDRAGSPRVAIVSESLARKYWPHDSALGATLTILDGKQAIPLEIVGVAGNVRQLMLIAEAEDLFYVPYSQFELWGDPVLLVRTPAAPMRFADAVKREIRAIDPDQPVQTVEPLDRVYEREVATPRFYTTLLGAFALLALTLATIGIGGLTAYAVSRRRQEVGLRIALGARRQDILRLFLATSTKLVVTGLTLGFAGALALTRYLDSLLYGITPSDPLTFAATLALLLAVTVAASLAAAHRATTISPNRILRYE